MRPEQEIPVLLEALGDADKARRDLERFYKQAGSRLALDAIASTATFQRDVKTRLCKLTQRVRDREGV